MSFADVERSIYYPEDYNYKIYYENELKNHDPLDLHSSPKPNILPTINYLNERKCPIYVHRIKNDFSILNNYNQKRTTPRKNIIAQKNNSQNASKFVLDKLEETYWATWKPKKQDLPVNERSFRKIPELGFSDVKPVFKVYNKGARKVSNKPHGDVNDNILKYFKAKNFDSSSTAASVTLEKINSKINRSNSTSPNRTQDGSNTSSVLDENTDNIKSYQSLRPRRFEKVSQKDSISQEIQTEMQCPVILPLTREKKEDKNSMQVIFEKEEEQVVKIYEEEIANKIKQSEENTKAQEEKCKKNNEKSKKYEEKKKQQEENCKKSKSNKKEEEDKQHSKNKKLRKESKKNLEETQDVVVLTETEPVEDSVSLNTFVDHKDSIEITKEKQGKSTAKDHYQQPKCIRLYRKSGSTSGYIKGGTYPLKSCLKKESFMRGNFRLGAPGSPLLVTTSSFSGKKRK